jgi:hypothetical protein
MGALGSESILSDLLLMGKLDSGREAGRLVGSSRLPVCVGAAEGQTLRDPHPQQD